MSETTDKRERFKSRVDTLVKQIQEWVEPHEWVTKTYSKKMRDANRKVYEVVALFLQRGPIRVLLDPIAYDVPGAEGAIDLYLMPTYDDMASLYFESGRWMIHYSFPPDPNETRSAIEDTALPLSEKTINDVLESIAAHAEPSF